MDFDAHRRSRRASGAAPLTRSERLDRLPFSPEHRRLVLGVGTCGVSAAAD